MKLRTTCSCGFNGIVLKLFVGEMVATELKDALGGILLLRFSQRGIPAVYTYR